MKYPFISSSVIMTTFCLTFLVAHEKFKTQDNANLLPRRDMECTDGFGGVNCKEDVDECKGLPYPCAGGTKEGSFCVDYDPPAKFKCGCRPGFVAVLPDSLDVKDPVPVEWRPMKCIPRDVCVDVVCHEDATCVVSSSNTAVCICNDDLIGDGITSCSPKPSTVIAKPSSLQSPPCKADSDCNKIENSVCAESSCTCKSGFYQSNGKGRCINENECADTYPNDCHKNAICKDMEGSYICTCMDGYRDLNPNDKPGTICTQINECLDPSMNDCNIETHVCLDLPPPSKWQCIDRTPAPTPAPAAFCYNDQPDISETGFFSPDTGCTGAKPFCATGPSKGGNRCVECINDRTGNDRDLDVDSGCAIFEYLRFCDIQNNGVASCGECIVGTDSGCEFYEGDYPYCVTTPDGRNACGECIDDKAGDDPTDPDFGCSKNLPFCQYTSDADGFYDCVSP